MMQPKGVSDYEWLGKCVRTIDKSVPNEQDRKDLLASTSILAGLAHDVNFVQTFIPEEIMRQSSVVREIIRKERAQERAQVIIKNIELRIGTLDEYIKTRILAIQNEALLDHLHRQSVLAEKDDIEKEIMALSA
ncbi:hypothetical protein FJZ31_17345 [Candidatus Poribacteria bacterium]|nr:hypothetical protein [Candidatus Poribacteria bacterium]